MSQVVAIAGATGAVGTEFIKLLEQRNYPLQKLKLLASARSVGKQLRFREQTLTVEELRPEAFQDVDVAFFSAGGDRSKEFAPAAVEAGALVIDNSSAFRMDDGVPLVVPEINAEVARRHRGLIANPNCSTIQMVVALKPIYDAVGIERINVATYQAVSGAGRSAVEDLVRQTTTLLNGRPLELSGPAKQIAFNAVPHIDQFQENRYTKEEMKMVWETRKILGDDEILVNPTAVRIPAFYGHSEAVHIETRDKISAEDVCELMRNAPGIELVDGTETGMYPTAVTESSGTDPVYVGRVREDISHPRGINLWVVSDNIRKGAALNSVQIAEILAKNYL